MFDVDAVIIGGGPAGLTAGIYLRRAGWRTLLLEKENFGGYLKSIERIENYPGYSDGVAGTTLADEMIGQARAFGVQLEIGEVTELELFSKTRWVGCDSGKGYTTAVVIVAGGCKKKKLGVPGEALLAGKGVFSCALCDGGAFADRTVAICGGGDSAVTEAGYMARLAKKVYLIEAEPELTACSMLQDRLSKEEKIEVICGSRVTEILGTGHVEGIVCSDASGGGNRTLEVDGVLVHIGMEPNSDFLDGLVPLTEDQRVMVAPDMASENPYVFAAGDIRSGSPCQVATAVGDGAMAAIAAQKALQAIKGNG